MDRLCTKLDDRGRMFGRANDSAYEGMVVSIHNRDNATRTKQLTNFRVFGKEDAIDITPKSMHLCRCPLKEHELKQILSSAARPRP